MPAEAATTIDLANELVVGRRESALLSIAINLGARGVDGWTATEEELITRRLPKIPNGIVDEVRDAIIAGHDPLGDAFCTLRTAAVRRATGATFTPKRIVSLMLEWAANYAAADRVVDPGCGSGRFILHAGRAIPGAELIGVEIDPVALILARANVAASGLAGRTRLELADYREFQLPRHSGRTLFIGNPPYVRHHELPAEWKQWLVVQAKKRGLPVSQLAGLHIYFYLATVLKASEGDFGSFITAAEWLDVNYGKLLRELFLGELGGKRIIVVEPTVATFPDAAATAAITQFEIKSHNKSIRLKRVGSIDELCSTNGDRKVRRERMESENRWSHMTRIPDRATDGFVELGEICRVHRGQVTGANKFWIAGPHTDELPRNVLFPSVTRAKELFLAGQVLDDASHLRCVVDLPADLGVFDDDQRRAIDRFLRRARKLSIHTGYVASNRRAWWSVGLHGPAPILATYMARRPPAFVVNDAEARHINIAHGLYPRESLSRSTKTRLVEFLATQVKVSYGRTYCGGLTKFEPREMERLLVPGPEMLRRGFND